jgi:hypothetical protein
MYIHSATTSINTSTKHPQGYMFRPSRAIIRPHIWTGSFDYSTFWDSQTVYKGGIVMLCASWYIKVKTDIHHHHHIQEGLGLIPVPCTLKMKLVPPSPSRSSYVFRPFGLYCSACLGILFVSILCMCCSHFSWCCFISFTIFFVPVFSLMYWFFSLSSFI